MELSTTLRISNPGQVAAREAVATLYLAWGIVILKAEATRGEVAIRAGQVVLEIGRIAPGETLELQAWLHMPEDLARGMVLENQADLVHADGEVVSAPSLLVTAPATLPETGARCGWAGR